MNLMDSMAISAMGMKAQGVRIRTISENVANADTAANTPDEDPYARQVTTFKNVLDRKMGFKTVQVDKVEKDTKTPFPKKYMPDHPGADESGYVQMPNVDSLIEFMDMREAQRSYEANLGMIRQARSMILRTIELLNT